MGKTEKLLKAWKSGAKFDVRCEDALSVLRDFGFDLRTDGGNHWLATHKHLGSHPQFPLGRIKINCHFRGNQGVVHPAAIGDILKAIKHLESKDDES